MTFSRSFVLGHIFLYQGTDTFRIDRMIRVGDLQRWKLILTNPGKYYASCGKYMADFEVIGGCTSHENSCTSPWRIKVKIWHKLNSELIVLVIVVQFLCAALGLHFVIKFFYKTEKSLISVSITLLVQPQCRWIVRRYSPLRFASRWISSLQYSPPSRWIIGNHTKLVQIKVSSLILHTYNTVSS